MPARVLLFAAPLVARANDLIELLQQQKCQDCRLADVDLVHADLRDADLQRAQLQRVAAKGHSDPKKRPSLCCSPRSTPA